MNVENTMNDTLFNLESFLSEVGMLKRWHFFIYYRMHRDIDGEEFMEMVKRKFGDANIKFKEIRQSYIKFKEY